MTERRIEQYALEAISPAFGLVRMKEFFHTVAAEAREEGIKEGQKQVERLKKALFAHRADLHCFSRRPCPTCRQSAEALGIQDHVPDCCAREETDLFAIGQLKEPG